MSKAITRVKTGGHKMRCFLFQFACSSGNRILSPAASPKHVSSCGVFFVREKETTVYRPQAGHQLLAFTWPFELFFGCLLVFGADRLGKVAMSGFAC